MTTNFHQLRLRQLDIALTHWREAKLPSNPATGWIRAIRHTLGISLAYIEVIIKYDDQYPKITAKYYS